MAICGVVSITKTKWRRNPEKTGSTYYQDIQLDWLWSLLSCVLPTSLGSRHAQPRQQFCTSLAVQKTDCNFPSPDWQFRRQRSRAVLETGLATGLEMGLETMLPEWRHGLRGNLTPRCSSIRRRREVLTPQRRPPPGLETELLPTAEAKKPETCILKSCTVEDMSTARLWQNKCQCLSRHICDTYHRNPASGNNELSVHIDILLRGMSQPVVVATIMMQNDFHWEAKVNVMLDIRAVWMGEARTLSRSRSCIATGTCSSIRWGATTINMYMCIYYICILVHKISRATVEGRGYRGCLKRLN